MRHKAAGNFIWDYTLSMTVYWMCTGTLIAKLTESHGMSVALSNMVVSLPSMLLVLQLFGGFLYSKTKQKHKFLLTSNTLWRLLVPLVFFSILAPKNLGALIMIVVYIAMVCTYHVSLPAYNTWLVNATSGKVKSNYLSIRDTAFIGLLTVTTYIYGMIANNSVNAKVPKLGFSIIGAVQLLLAIWSLFFLFRRLPAVETNDKIKTALSIKQVLKKPFETKGFTKVIAQNMMWNFAAMFIGNFGAIYQVRVLSLQFSDIIFWGTVASVARVLCTPLFAKIADKISWKRMTQITFLLIISAAVLWTQATKENAFLILPIASILGAIPYAGLGIGLFKYQVLYSEPETRSLTFSVCSAASGMAAFLGTTVCTALVAFLETFAQPPFWIIFCVGIFFTTVTICIIQATPYKEPQ